jgi:hypothetical protein
MPDVSPSDHPLLYRALKRAWLDLRSNAFRLRPAANERPPETSLSVLLWANCTKDFCQANRTRCAGEFVLETAKVAAKWRVDLKGNNHAGIHGLPMYGDAELAIEEAATELENLIVEVRPH